MNGGKETTRLDDWIILLLYLNLLATLLNLEFQYNVIVDIDLVFQIQMKISEISMTISCVPLKTNFMCHRVPALSSIHHV